MLPLCTVLIKETEGFSTTLVKGLRSDRCKVALKHAAGTSVKLPASVLNESFHQGIVSLECERIMLFQFIKVVQLQMCVWGRGGGKRPFLSPCRIVEHEN